MMNGLTMEITRRLNCILGLYSKDNFKECADIDNNMSDAFNHDEDSNKKNKRKGKNQESINEKQDLNVIESLWDVTEQNSVLCNGNKFGYELKGSDFKTLEFPVINYSYKVKNPGWLNNNIVDAYISLLVKTAAGRNLHVNALNCFFYEKVVQIVVQKSK